MSQPTTAAQKTNARWQPVRSRLFAAAVLLAVAVTCISPDLRTVLFLGGALLALGVLLWLLQHLASTSRRFRVHVSPGIAVMTITISLVLAMAEICLRLFLFNDFPQWEPIARAHEGLGYQHDRTLGWFPVPNSRRTFLRNGRRILAAHNSEGFRDPEPVVDARPGIMFIGDSFVWGYNVAAEDRFTEKLRARHPEWRVYNCGVVGYGTGQEYLLLQEFLPEYDPAVVFLIFCVENDELNNRSNGGGLEVYKPYYTVEQQGLALHGVPVPLSDRVFCARHPLLSRFYLSRLAMRAWGNIRCPPDHAMKSPTTALLAAIRKYVVEHDAVFCVGLTGRNQPVERYLQRSKILWVDLSTNLRGRGDFHWGPKGHTFVANKIEHFLLSGKCGGLAPPANHQHSASR